MYVTRFNTHYVKDILSTLFILKLINGSIQ